MLALRVDSDTTAYRLTADCSALELPKNINKCKFYKVKLTKTQKFFLITNSSDSRLSETLYRIYIFATSLLFISK